MTDQHLMTWGRIILRALAAAALSSVVCAFYGLPPITLLAALFGAGAAAGAWARRQGWFSGILVGLPSALIQVTRWAGPEAGTPDYWRIAVPAALVAAGMAVLGGMTGAWLRGMRLQR